ncbi:MAG: gliding motility-associated C-terminal domain-containing protein [Bacteroidota bacterium]
MKITWYVILVLVSLMPVLGSAQGVGRTIINQSFGEGLVNPGEPISPGKTNYTYSSDTCLATGSYALVNSLFRCVSTRIGRSLDNTPSSNNGYMMVVSPPGDKEMLVYADTVKQELCANTSYEFSAYLINASIPKECAVGNPPLPRFKLSIETLSGIVLSSVNTGALPYAYNFSRTPQFTFYAADLVMPAGIGTLVLKITSLDHGIVPCNFYVAIDDIQFTAKGPAANIVFEAGRTDLVKQICYLDNQNITIKGEVGAYYPNTAFQWQQSTDNGIFWKDIPGATASDYNNTFSVADTFLFRLSAADVKNIGNVNCRVVSNVLKVEVNGAPVGFKISSNSPVCVGVDVVFSSQLGEGLFYEWSGPNGFYDNVYYPSVNHTQLKDSGMYYVLVTTVGGCRFKDSTYVKVYGPGAVTAGRDTAICLGGSVQLHGSNGLKINWSPGNSLSDSTISNPVATPVVTTLYTLRVIDLSECVSTASVTVRLLNNKVIKAKINGPGFLCRSSDSATFYNTSEGDLAYYNWDFGNGQVSALKDPQVVNYNIPGNIDFYNARLIVSDSSGCTDTAYHQTKVAGNCYIAVPSGFTPNGDGNNDYLYPLNAYKATDLIFRVFNRNGQVIFQTRDWTKKWDGRINGMLQPTGLYVWALNYRDGSNKIVNLKGTTMLIR